MKRNTYQQQLILDTILQFQGHHLSADAVYEIVSSSIQTISRSTVYRILNQLAEEDIIQKLHIPSEADRYDDRLDHHYHLHCSSCRKILDINMPVIADLYDRISPSECVITGHDILFHGLCPECKFD